MTQTFTFPSSTAVELPEGMPLCQNPAGDTRCPAYNRANSVHRQQAEVAGRERILASARSLNRPTSRLTEWLEHHRRVLDQMLTQCATNPAPCTCKR